MYLTEPEINTALNNGYTVIQSPQSGASFKHGKRRIWATKNGWQTADLIDDYYKNHQKFESLTDALNRPFTD